MADEYVVDVQLGVSVAEWVVRLVETAVVTTLHQEQTIPPVELSLLLTDDKTLQQLNHTFRGEDSPTDVLSFPAGDPLPDTPGHTLYLGDIAISVPTAKRQAAASGHPAEAELQLLAVHGVLHLLGYDHLEPKEKEAMWAAQTAVLRQLGLETILPTETEHD